MAFARTPPVGEPKTRTATFHLTRPPMTHSTHDANGDNEANSAHDAISRAQHRVAQAADEGRLSLKITPAGALTLARDDEAPHLRADLRERLAAAFAQGSGAGLTQLGAGEPEGTLPPVLAWWREFSKLYVSKLRLLPEDAPREPQALSARELAKFAAGIPPMAGSEYATPEALGKLWSALGQSIEDDISRSGLSLREWLVAKHPAWNQVGRVFFNVAENRADEEAPFAFLATCSVGLTPQGRPRHAPLVKTVEALSAAGAQQELLRLLLPVQRAAEKCDWLQEMVDKGEIYHPLRWSPADAWKFLADTDKLQEAGVIARLPSSWQSGRPSRPAVSASVGTQEPSKLGMAALMDFKMEVSLNGQALTPEEITQIRQGSGGLQLLRGQWIEVDKEKMERVMDRFKDIERDAKEHGLPFAQAMKLAAGVAGADGDPEPLDADWATVSAGPWLAQTLQSMRAPEALAAVDPGEALHATLRPYQEHGLRWMHLLVKLGFGACLADDMGLGKTMQILALLLTLKKESEMAPKTIEAEAVVHAPRADMDAMAGNAAQSPRAAHLPANSAASLSPSRAKPSLLVAPASLLSNWAAEARTFAPSLRVLVAHSSEMDKAEFKSLDAQRFAGFDLVITSYGSLAKSPPLATNLWRVAILDEAQAIKNPSAKQTRLCKTLRSESRIALTGTPVENKLSDLWSIFDFANPGLLGNAKEFAALAKAMADQKDYAPLRALAQPYILRRLKTDKSVISDLPDKTELNALCGITPAQATLYSEAVNEMARKLESATGIGRKGLVLSSIMRLKQICNHPSQATGDETWSSADSGKFERLGEIARIVAAKQEKMLVFTQFQEMTGPLSDFLAQVFGKPGVVLHGGTPVAARPKLVKRFQEDDDVPFFVLSIKAGGSGLNLTAASHVVHFDRWWNPAVENQATDRAFRIGQKKNVLVHKFVCKGTVEDRIDEMIESKKALAKEALEGGQEISLTQLSDKELLDLVKLDIHAHLGAVTENEESGAPPEHPHAPAGASKKRSSAAV